MASLQSIKMGALMVFMAAALLLSACSGNGGGDDSSTSSETGGITVSVADAALENFSSFEMDVMQVWLHSGSEIEIVVNPQTYASGVRHLNLLSNQGLSALFGSVQVPEGTYDRISIFYFNVSGQDTGDVDQTINLLDRSYSASAGYASIWLDNGLPFPDPYYGATIALSSPLVVSADSTQSLSLDFDLNNSITATDDPDTWNFALTVAAKPQQKAEPVECFPVRITDTVSDAAQAAQMAAVAALDASTLAPLVEQAFGFEDTGGLKLNAKMLSGKSSDATETGDIELDFSGHPSGSMIAGSDGAVFEHGHWIGALGGALGATDSSIIWGSGGEMEYVCIEGKLLNGTIAVSRVTEYKPSVQVSDTAAIGVSLRGCIVDVDIDDDSGTMTVAVDKQSGNISEIDYLEEVDFNVNENTTINRSKTALIADDLTPYNYCEITANEANGNFTATKISIIPSFIEGTVTAFTEEAGENDGDLISFTPTVVNLFRGDGLDPLFVANGGNLPATLNFEVFNKSLEAGDKVKIMGFFSPDGDDVSNLIKTKQYGGVAGLQSVNADSGAEMCVSLTHYSDSSTHDDGWYRFTGENEVFFSDSIPFSDDVLLVRIDAQLDLSRMVFGDAVDLITGAGTLGDGSTPAVVCGRPNGAGTLVGDVFYLLDSADISLDTENTFSLNGFAPASAVATDTTLDFTMPTDTSNFTVNATDATRIRVYNEKNVPTTLTLEEAETRINSGAIEYVQVVNLESVDDSDGNGILEMTKVLAINFVDVPPASKPDPKNTVVRGKLSPFPAFDTDNDGVADAIVIGDDTETGFGFIPDNGTGLPVLVASSVPVLLVDKEGNSTEVKPANRVALFESNPLAIEVEYSPGNSAVVPDVAVRAYGNPNVDANDIDWGTQLTGGLNAPDDVVEQYFALGGGQQTQASVDYLQNYFQGALAANELVIYASGPGGVSKNITFSVDGAAAVETVVDGVKSDAGSGLNGFVSAWNSTVDAMVANGNYDNPTLTLIGSQSYGGKGNFSANVKVIVSDGTTPAAAEDRTYTVSGTVSDASDYISTGAGDITIQSGDTEIVVTLAAGNTLLRSSDGAETSLSSMSEIDAALNAAAKPFVVCEGSAPKAADGTFTADKKVVINKGLVTEAATTVLTGKLDEDSIAGISGGKISFDLLTAQGTLVTVFAPSSLEDEEMLILNTPEGGNQTLTVKSAAKKINELTGATIRAEGKSAPTAAGFSADVSLTITKKAATSATLSGFATTTASLNSAGGVDFTLEDENGEEFSVTVASTATVTYHRNSGTDSFTGDLESLEVLIDGGDDGFIELGGTLSGSSFTASICTVYQAPEDTTGGDSGGAIIAGALVGAVTDFQFTVDFYDWTTGDAENVTVTVPNVSGITYIIYDEDAVATTATRAQALAALQDNPAFVEAMGSESYTSGDGEYSADLGVTIVAESGQFGANAYFGTLASGSVATVVNGDVVFDLLVEDEFGSTTIEVTIDVSEATVTFYDSFFNDEVITAAQTIANRINNDADGIFVSSLSGQSGETFTADDVVELYEASTGGGDFGILTGVMKSGTTASGSSGNLVFTMSVNLPDGSTTDVAVTVSSSAYFELFDMSGPSTVTPTAMADALNANPTTHYTFVQGSIPYNGEATYFADTYISTSIFGQSTFLFGIPASAATVNGNDVEFDLDTYDEIGNPITVVVTIDTTLATVTHRDENFIETTLTTAQDVADYINDETMEMFLESSSVQSGGTFLADVTVDLYGASTGGGGGGAFIDGHMTPDTTASAATGDLVFSFDTLDPMSGSDLTVTVTVASSAQFDIIDFDGTPYFDVGAQAMADEMNANGDLSAIFVYGSLEWNGETAYFADGGMTLSLIGGTGGAFVYWGTVDTSTNAPMFDGNNIIFDLEVFEGAFEGPVTPQVVTVTASPLAFIQSFTTANGFQPETDGNTIAGLLDAMPFEVEVALTAQLDVGTSAYTLDAGGHMFIFVDDPSGGGGGGGGGGVTVDLDAYELVEGGGFFTLVVSGGMAPYTISQVSNVMINGYVTDFPSIGLTENSPNDLDISDDDSALVAGDVVTFDVVIQDANMDTSASTPITLNIISAGGGGITVDVDSYDLVEGGGIFGLLVSGGMGPYTISQVSNVVHSTLGPTTFAALGLTENAPGDLEIADDGMTLVAGDVVTFDVVIEDANMDTSASTPITLNIISAGGGGINVDILTYDLTAGGNMISLMVSGGTGPYTIQSVTNVMLNGNPTDFATIGLTENSPAGLDISDSGATLVAGDVVMFDVVIEDSTTATSAPFTIIVTVVP